MRMATNNPSCSDSWLETLIWLINSLRLTLPCLINTELSIGSGVYLNVVSILVLTLSGSPHFDQSIWVQNSTGLVLHSPRPAGEKEILAIFAETSNKTFFFSTIFQDLYLDPSVEMLINAAGWEWCVRRMWGKFKNKVVSRQNRT